MGIEKPWGSEEIMIQTSKYVVKRLLINANSRLSLQYHRQKMESVIVQGWYGLGPLYLTLDGKESVVEAGHSFTVNPGQVHRFAAKEKPVVLLEVSTPELEDVVRIEDDYQRAG